MSPSASSSLDIIRVVTSLLVSDQYFNRDSSIPLKLYRRVKHHRIHVKYEGGGCNPQTFDWVMTLLYSNFGKNVVSDR